MLVTVTEDKGGHQWDESAYSEDLRQLETAISEFSYDGGPTFLMSESFEHVEETAGEGEMRL